MKTPLSAYGAVLEARFRTLLQYRAAAAAGFATQLFWGLIRVAIFTAFYQSGSAAHQPMSLPEVIDYIWLTQAMLMLQPWGVDPDVRNMVRTGTVAYELLRPVDLYWLWFTRTVAQRTAPMLLRAVPMLLVAGLFLGLRPPASPAAALGSLLCTATAVALSSAISTLVLLSLLWTVSGEGISRLMPAASMIFSGILLPLPLFPEWAQPVLQALPFRGLADLPFRVYIGHIPAQELIGVLLHQLLWTAALVWLGRRVLVRGLRAMVVQGG